MEPIIIIICTDNNGQRVKTILTAILEESKKQPTIMPQ